MAIAEKMQSEMGAQAAVESFHRNLPLERLQCAIYPHQPAAWSFSKRNMKIKLSKIAAETVLSKTSVDRGDMKLYVLVLAPSHLVSHALKS